MAAVTINVTMLDAKGKSSVTKIRVPTGFTLSQYASFAYAIGQLICNMTDGAITNISVSVPVDLSGATIRAFATTIADVAKKLLILARSSVTGLFARFTIPTYNEGNSITGSDQADPADPDIAALIALVEDGVNVGGVFIQPCDLRENDLVDVSEAREIFRKFN
jgi:hypothetical protein